MYESVDVLKCMLEVYNICFLSSLGQFKVSSGKRSRSSWQVKSLFTCRIDHPSQRQSWTQLSFMTALHEPMDHLFRWSSSNHQHMIKFVKLPLVELHTVFW